MKRVCTIALLLFALCDSHAQLIADNRPISVGDGLPNKEPLVCPLVPAVAEPWQKDEDHVFGHIRGNRLAMMKSTSEDIISVFHDSILTDGSFNTVWHGEYFSAGNGTPQMRFGVSCVFHNGDQEGNQPNDLTIFANDISPLIGELSVNGQKFVTLKGYIGGDASPIFQFDMPAGSDDNATMRVKAWLVTADSSLLPYIPVTRKEYLESARQELETRKAAIIADIQTRIPIRSAVIQEAAKQQSLDQLRNTYSGMEQDTRVKLFLARYKSDEDYMKQNILEGTENLDRTIAVMTRLLTSCTAKQLAQPALVSVASEEFRGFEDGQPNSTMLVRLRVSYYPGEVDQIKSLLICWRYRPSDPMAAGIDRQLAMRNPIPRLRKQFHTGSM